MVNEELYDINYDGDILWQGPGNKIPPRDSEMLKNVYHHEFTRLANGHYMALRMEHAWWQLPSATSITAHDSADRMLRFDKANNKWSQQIIVGTIDEFDRRGKRVWSWSAADYLMHSDLYDRKKTNGQFDLTDTHENAFFFDEKKNELYVSFRNINRIVKLQYPSGKVLDVFGTLYTPGDRELNNDLFCGQHNCRVSKDGYLYCFNNNTCNYPCQKPTIIMIQQPAGPNGQMKKVWEYQCTVDGLSASEHPRLTFETGGSVFELPDGSMFCSTGNNPYCKIFIVDHNKNILWAALPEVWNKKTKDWVIDAGYRASIITRKQLEGIIWNDPTTN